MSNRIRSLLAALSALLLAGPCLAQGTGVIYGTVTDPSGAGVAGSKVEALLIGRGTMRAGATSASGEYVFPAMPIGAWEIRVTAAGFQPPMRLFTFFGFSCAALSLLVAVIYTLYKLLFWRSFSVGIAPVVIGIFFLGSVQLAFIGLLSEYIGAIHTQVMARPLVVERERINFEDPKKMPV